VKREGKDYENQYNSWQTEDMAKGNETLI